jgi:DNA uptake protein ComE-like DNA-binding protein
MSEENLQRMKPHLFIDETEDFPKKDLNQVSARELAYLSLIDKAAATQFIAYRRKLGRFSSWSEVAEMEGMSEEVYHLLRAYYNI